jgi:hypothetical protein
MPTFLIVFILALSLIFTFIFLDDPDTSFWSVLPLIATSLACVMVLISRFDPPTMEVFGPASSTPAQSSAIEAESGLVVEPWSAPEPYDRSLFGVAWSDVDHNGCDTRNDVLNRDLTDKVWRDGTHDCVVIAGTLHDWYSDQTVPFVKQDASKVQIDHVVPLAYAWGHGAATWTDAERLEFANDPANLVATQGTLNQQKGSKGPSEWAPPATDAWCRYMRTFETVAQTYGLSVSPTDAEVLSHIPGRC